MRYSRLLASSRAHGLVFRPLPFKAFAPCTGASSSVAKPRNDFHLEFCAQGMGRAAAAPNVRRYTALSAAPVVDAPTSTSQNTDVEFEAVIGIETHVQLLTQTKAFCNCSNAYGAEPNTHVCPVCMGHPGALPLPNSEAVNLAIRAGLALNCEIARESKFDRKQYFYADLPKGYQISQYDTPICGPGALEVELPDGSRKRFGIERAHLEEDAGKSVYGGAAGLAASDYSLLDYNRAGVPLLEIVSAPDMRSGKDAYAYGAELRRIVRFLGISSGEMQEGSMRCDVNVSVRPKGASALGTKVEVKNMNSFSNMQKAIEFEVERQVGLIRAGKKADVVQETRLWDENKQVTYSMRKKEGLSDYRYFPEPDLPRLTVTEEQIEHVRATMPEMPAAKRARYAALGLPRADVLVLTEEAETAAYFDAALAAGAAPKGAANWIMGDLAAHCKEAKIGMDAVKLSPVSLAEMLSLIEDGTISGKIAKDLLPALLAGEGGGGVKALAEAKGMLQVSDVSAVEAMVDAVLAAHPAQLAEYRAGKTKLAGFFTGQVMKESQGKVNPGLMNQVLQRRLKGE